MIHSPGATSSVCLKGWQKNQITGGPLLSGSSIAGSISTEIERLIRSREITTRTELLFLNKIPRHTFKGSPCNTDVSTHR